MNMRDNYIRKIIVSFTLQCHYRSSVAFPTSNLFSVVHSRVLHCTFQLVLHVTCRARHGNIHTPFCLTAQLDASAQAIDVLHLEVAAREVSTTSDLVAVAVGNSINRAIVLRAQLYISSGGRRCRH